MRALQQTLQSSRVAGASNMQRMQASRPQCHARQLRRPLSHTNAISLMSASSQRYSVVAKAGGLGGFMQGLAAKLTGARNADDATPSGAYSLLEDERAVLIDIRPKGEAGKAGSPDLREFKGKRIVSLPFDYEAPEEFVIKYLRLSAVDPDSLVLLLDSDGSDAPQAAAALAADKDTLGQKFYPIRGGAVAWQEAELPWRAGGLLPGLSLASLPTNLDQLAEEFKANPSIGSAALSLAAIIGSATFIISEFDVILEVAGVLGVSVFSIKNLLYAEDREKLLRRMSLFLKDEVGAEAASEELKKLAERALAASENKASKSSGGGSLGAEISSWITGWQAKQQEVTAGMQQAVAVAADSAKQRADESELRRKQQAEAMAMAAAAEAPPSPAAAAPAAAATPAPAPAAKASAPAKRMQSVQEARQYIAEWNAKRAQQAKQAEVEAEAVAAAGTSSAAEQTPAATAAAAPATAAATPATAPAADIEQANVQEAREWIAAWAAKQEQSAAEAAVVAQPAPTAAADATARQTEAKASVPANVQEARDWIAKWQATTAKANEATAAEAKAEAPATTGQSEVPANVQSARDWISSWQAKQLAEQSVQLSTNNVSVKADSAGHNGNGNGNGQVKTEAPAVTEVVRKKETVNA